MAAVQIVTDPKRLFPLDSILDIVHRDMLDRHRLSAAVSVLAPAQVSYAVDMVDQKGMSSPSPAPLSSDPGSRTSSGAAGMRTRMASTIRFPPRC